MATLNPAEGQSVSNGVSNGACQTREPGTKEGHDKEQVSPTVLELHFERRVELISDLQNRVKWTPRWTVGIPDLILAVATVQCVFWVVQIATVNRHKFSRPCQAGLSDRRIEDSKLVGSTFDDESSIGFRLFQIQTTTTPYKTHTSSL